MNELPPSFIPNVLNLTPMPPTNKRRSSRLAKKARQIGRQFVAGLPPVVAFEAVLTEARNLATLAQTGVNFLRTLPADLAHDIRTIDIRSGRNRPSTMPRFTRPKRKRNGSKRKRRGSKRGKGRKRRKSSARKAHRSTMALRLYPGGVPKTHIVKLRAVQQVAIFTRSGEWGFFTFSPSSMLKPFEFSDTVALGTHRVLRYADKGNVIPAAGTNRQPYGYDHWLSPPGGTTSQYKKYKVLGSKIRIAVIPGTGQSSTTASYNFYAGFSKISGQDNTYPNFITDQYSNIGSFEVGDWINTGIVKRMQIIQVASDSVLLAKVGAGFEANYSQKKYASQLKRVGKIAGSGTSQADWYGTHDKEPVIKPVFHFCIGDVGTDTASQRIQAIVSVDYTVELSDLHLGNHSSV